MENAEGKSLVKKERKLSKELILLIMIIAMILVVDQAFKIWIQNIEQVSVIPNILNFKLSQNTSAAYGIGSNSTKIGRASCRERV